jgi:hypothetical protein
LGERCNVFCYSLHGGVSEYPPKQATQNPTKG